MTPFVLRAALDVRYTSGRRHGSRILAGVTAVPLHSTSHERVSTSPQYPGHGLSPGDDVPQGLVRALSQTWQADCNMRR